MIYFFYIPCPFRTCGFWFSTSSVMFMFLLFLQIPNSVINLHTLICRLFIVSHWLQYVPWVPNSLSPLSTLYIPENSSVSCLLQSINYLFDLIFLKIANTFGLLYSWHSTIETYLCYVMSLLHLWRNGLVLPRIKKDWLYTVLQYSFHCFVVMFIWVS